MKANYVQVTGEGHCFSCHKDYKNVDGYVGDTLHPDCKGGEPTPFACDKCKKPMTNPIEEKLKQISSIHPVMAEEYVRESIRQVLQEMYEAGIKENAIALTTNLIKAFKEDKRMEEMLEGVRADERERIAILLDKSIEEGELNYHSHDFDTDNTCGFCVKNQKKFLTLLRPQKPTK